MHFVFQYLRVLNILSSGEENLHQLADAALSSPAVSASEEAKISEETTTPEIQTK